MGQKIIVILGPTASGKSDLAVNIAKRFNGEVISADSRQVYRGMNIGSGKITKKEMKGIPHYLLDIASPKSRFTVAQYQKLASATINNIIKKGKIPIICGGTGFYIQSIVDGIVIPEVKPDYKLRAKLEKKSADELYKILKKLDPRRAKAIERKNPRRLIRAIEIVKKSKKPVPEFKTNPPSHPILIMGIKKSKEELKKLIHKRLIKRLGHGMIAEIKALRKSGVSWQKLESFGLEYRWIARLLQNKISKKEMIEKLQTDIEHFAARQMTWFKRDNRIHWIIKTTQAEKLVRIFLK